MSKFTISANLDVLQKLPDTDDYLFHNYKWETPFPDIPNRVSLSFPEWQEAAAVYHELWKLRVTPLFRNWN